MLKAVYSAAFARANLRPVFFKREGFVQDLVDQRGFSAPGDAGNADQFSKRDLHIEVFQVVFRGASDDQAFSVPGSAFFRQGDKALAAEIKTLKYADDIVMMKSAQRKYEEYKKEKYKK